MTVCVCLALAVVATARRKKQLDAMEKSGHQPLTGALSAPAR